MNTLISLLLFVFFLHPVDAEENAPKAITRDDAEKMLKSLKEGKTPNIYRSVFAPSFKDDKDGLKRIAVELIAEHTNRELKKGIKLEVRRASNSHSFTE